MYFLRGCLSKTRKNTISVFTYVIENSSKNIFLKKKNWKCFYRFMTLKVKVLVQRSNIFKIMLETSKYHQIKAVFNLILLQFISLRYLYYVKSYWCLKFDKVPCFVLFLEFSWPSFSKTAGPIAKKIEIFLNVH